MKKFFLFILSLTMLLPLASCGTKPPELETVRDEFISLIAASFEINDIFFGEGLPVYDRNTTTGAGIYDEEHNVLYWIINDKDVGQVVKYYDYEEKNYHFLLRTDKESDVPAGTEPYVDADGYFLFPISYKEKEMSDVYDDKSPVYYDFVRLDCPYQDVKSIKDAAEKVYSSAYLSGVYGVIFDGLMTDNAMIYARYMADETGENEFFLKSNRFDPMFSEQCTYDYSTMKIVKPSNAERVTVEIEAEGVHVDFEKAEKVVGKYVREVTFVLENGKWRLDGPTY